MIQIKEILELEIHPSLDLVSQSLDKHVMPVAVSRVNWSEYPYQPEVSIQLAYNEKALFLKFNVREQAVMARVSEPNGPVWTDSCVEFFISPESNSDYYNIEMNCIGTPLLGYHTTGEATLHATAEQIKAIRTKSTLGNETFDEKKGDFRWNLTAVIPFSALFKHTMKPSKGVKFKANFYKCGDHLTVPHFVAWTAICTEKPSFHQPDFFGEIEFA